MKHSPLDNALLVLAGFAVTGCGHTDSYPTGPVEPLPPLRTTELVQISFGSPQNDGFQWTPDGSGILYNFGDPFVVGGGNCFGIIPKLGGTRTWSYCDTRGENADSLVRYSSGALNAGGRFVFMEGVYRIPLFGAPPALTTTSIWLSDTSNPAGHRVRVAKLPIVVGDSVTSWISELGWPDENHFVFSGARYVTDANAIETPEPRQLILGTVTENSATLSPLIGGEFGYIWTKLADGSLVFLKAHYWSFIPPFPGMPFRSLLMDSLLWKISPDRNTVSQVVKSPRRLGSFQCGGGVCLATDKQDSCTPTTCVLTAPYELTCLVACGVSTTQFYYIDPLTWAFTTIPTAGLPYVFPTSPKMSPDGTEFAFLRPGQPPLQPGPFLYRAPFIHP